MRNAYPTVIKKECKKCIYFDIAPAERGKPRLCSCWKGQAVSTAEPKKCEQFKKRRMFKY